MAVDPLLNIVQRHKQGQPLGIYSVCSTHPYVLRAAMLQAKRDESMLLVESTSNQVDQFGGYTGMTPAGFVKYAREIAAAVELPWERVILGGDHLGPNVWQQRPADVAMANAADQIRAYVNAGYRKIHLDATFVCADDPSPALPLETIAKRTADLCRAAEDAAAKDGVKPVYVIGSEVPPPGGATHAEKEIAVTSVAAVTQTIERTRAAFDARGLQAAWQRVLAVVVQPGVEFGTDHVFDYQPAKARDLSAFIESQPGLVYEAHSTDYQTPHSLRALVCGHFAILKVGPGLTFALREAIFALAEIERLWLGRRKGVELSQLGEVIDREMDLHPEHWRRHYQGEDAVVQVMRKYGLSDRIRYYWPAAPIEASVRRLIENLRNCPPPLSLLSQFLPLQYAAVRDGSIKNTPDELIWHKIGEVLSVYSAAAGMDRKSL